MLIYFNTHISCRINLVYVTMTNRVFHFSLDNLIYHTIYTILCTQYNFLKDPAATRGVCSSFKYIRARLTSLILFNLVEIKWKHIVNNNSFGWTEIPKRNSCLATTCIYEMIWLPKLLWLPFRHVFTNHHYSEQGYTLTTTVWNNWATKLNQWCHNSILNR